MSSRYKEPDTPVWVKKERQMNLNTLLLAIVIGLSTWSLSNTVDMKASMAAFSARLDAVEKRQDRQADDLADLHGNQPHRRDLSPQ